MKHVILTSWGPGSGLDPSARTSVFEIEGLKLMKQLILMSWGPGSGLGPSARTSVFGINIYSHVQSV